MTIRENYAPQKFGAIHSYTVYLFGAHAQRGLQCVCVCVRACVRACVCGSTAIKSTCITKDTIMLSVRFAAILKWRFS